MQPVLQKKQKKLSENHSSIMRIMPNNEAEPKRSKKTIKIFCDEQTSNECLSLDKALENSLNVTLSDKQKAKKPIET